MRAAGTEELLVLVATDRGDGRQAVSNRLPVSGWEGEEICVRRGLRNWLQGVVHYSRRMWCNFVKVLGIEIVPLDHPRALWWLGRPITAPSGEHRLAHNPILSCHHLHFHTCTTFSVLHCPPSPRYDYRAFEDHVIALDSISLRYRFCRE